MVSPLVLDTVPPFHLEFNSSLRGGEGLQGPHPGGMGGEPSGDGGSQSLPPPPPWLLTELPPRSTERHKQLSLGEEGFGG